MAPFEATTCPRPSASSSASRKGLLVDAFTSSRAHYARTGGGRTKPRHLHHHACRHGRTLVRWLNEPWPLSRGRGRTRRRLAASTITNGASGHAELADFALPFAYGGGFRVALETRIVVDGALVRLVRFCLRCLRLWQCFSFSSSPRPEMARNAHFPTPTTWINTPQTPPTT